MPKNMTDELASASPNRRKFLKTIGVATAGVTAMSMSGVRTASAASSSSPTATEIEVLQFALNLEYLESEFYSYAVSGQGIESFGIGIDGLANGSNPTDGGTTTGGEKTEFTRTYTANVAAQIASDERAHVSLLRSALGSMAVARPNINVNALGLAINTENDFLRLSRIFEDIGVTAYAGAAGLLTTPSVITTAARILAVEAEHTASIRTQIFILNITNIKLDGADLVPPPSGPSDTVLSINPANGLVATRTPGEVLYLAFGNKANATSGGFFPTGINGAITTSTTEASPGNLK